MSMAESSSSLPQLSSFQLNICRWSWCSSTFPSSQDLVHHVLDQHIRNAIPVKRADLPMLQRVEEGVGDSLSLSGMMCGVSEPHAPSNSLNEPSSSLPSPPPSSPPSLSHPSPPTFASLASNTNSPSPSLGPIPEPPSLSCLVASATNPNKRKFGDNELASSKRMCSIPEQWSESSKSSQESRDCVEQQLTQSLEIGSESSDEDTGEDDSDSDVPIQKTGHKSDSHLASSDLYAGEIDWNPFERALAKTSKSSQSSSSVGVTFSSQGLLQPPSQRYLESTPRSQPPAAQSPTHAKFGTSPPSIFPSSITSSTPAGQGQQSWYNQNPASLLQPAPSQEFAYLLQTQAPYQSQSWSSSQ